MEISEVKGLVDDLGAAFDAFKVANDERLKEIETFGAASAETEAKVAKLDAALDEQSEALERFGKEAESEAKATAERVDELEAALNRARLGAGGGGGDDDKEVKQALEFARTAALFAGRSLDELGNITPDTLDLDFFAEYKRRFPLYLRKGETGFPTEFLAKAMSVGSDPEGGYFVTPDMSARIITTVFESSPLRELATVETISSAALELVVDDDEAAAGWVAEKEARPETATPQVRKAEIPAHEIYAEPRATQKLLDDAGIDVEAWLAAKVAEKFGRFEATAFVIGNGVGKPRGILTYAAGTSYGQIEQVNSGHASLVTADGLITLEGALKGPYEPGATWVMKRTTVTDVRKLKDSNGQYLWQPGLSQDQPPMLLGHPVRKADDMPAVAANALAIAFGNFSIAYTVVDRTGIRVLRDPFTAKPFVKFYTTRRVGGDVVNFEALKLQKIAA